MKEIDQALQARVWQRVQSGREAAEPPQLQPPCRVLALMWELAACYQALSRGGNRRMIRLEQQVRAAAATLRSVQALQGCTEERPGRYLPTRENRAGLVEKCCHLERRLAEALETQSADAQWGQVYAMLAWDARRRCMTMLALRGRQPGK